MRFDLSLAAFCALLYFPAIMAKRRVLIIGHSFIHRLKAFVQKERHILTFTALSGISQIHFHGVGGRTIAKFRKFDFDVVRRIAPDIIILELGSNDLVELAPQSVGSELETLARELCEFSSVQLVVIGQVLRRHHIVGSHAVVIHLHVLYLTFMA